MADPVVAPKAAPAAPARAAAPAAAPAPASVPAVAAGPIVSEQTKMEMEAGRKALGKFAPVAE